MQKRKETTGSYDHHHRYRNYFKYFILHSFSPLPDTVAGYALADGIGADYQDKVNSRLGKAHRSTDTEISLFQTDTVYEGTDYVAHLHDCTVLHNIGLFESDACHTANRQDQHDRDCTLDTGDGDGRHHTEPGAAVHTGRFVNFPIDYRQVGQLNKHVPADAFPDAHNKIGENPPWLISEEGNCFSSKSLDNGINQSG